MNIHTRSNPGPLLNVLFTLLIMVGTVCASPPPNDPCSGAEVIPGAGPFPYLTAVTADITDATTAGDPPAPSCQPNLSRSIWYTFTPTATAVYTISSCANAPTGTTVDDTVIGVYTSSGGCGGTFTQVTCDDDTCTSEVNQAVLSANLTSGTQYFVVVWKFGAVAPTAGNTAVQLSVSPELTPPANDLCSGAEVIPGAGPFPYLTAVTTNITDATLTGDPPAPSCQPNLSRSIWYTFTPTATALYTISSCANAPTGTTVDDTVIGVYTSSGGCGGTFTQVTCDDDTCTSEVNQAVLSANLTSGTQYFVVVWKFGAVAPTAGNTAVQLLVSSELTPPANDPCSGAEVIPGAGPFPYLTAVTTNITDATTAGDPPAPTCQPILSRSIWYTFTPTATAEYTISSCANAPTGTTVDDTVIGVYTSSAGCVGTFTQVQCDDDTCTSEGLQAVASANLTSGTQYLVVVWKFGATAPTAGNTAVQLRITQQPVQLKITSITRLGNDIVLQGLGVPSQGHTVQASPDLMTVFTNLAAVTADPAGVFQYQDTNAGISTNLFYRLSFP